MKSFALIATLALTPLLAVCAFSAARANPLGGEPDPCCHACPQCHYVCKLEAKRSEEEKSCFEVEEKVVCIPRVVFPWQKKRDPCAHNGARIRKICVLKTDSYKCPVCKYTWTAEKRLPCAPVAAPPAMAAEPIAN